MLPNPQRLSDVLSRADVAALPTAPMSLKARSLGGRRFVAD